METRTEQKTEEKTEKKIAVTKNGKYLGTLLG